MIGHENDDQQLGMGHNINQNYLYVSIHLDIYTLYFQPHYSS
jgi:hypothetical protein